MQGASEEETNSQTDFSSIGERIYEIAVQHDVAPDILVDMASDAIWQYSEKQERWHRLTPREQEVTALICSGHTNQQIAKQLHIRITTVKTHVRHILRKFELRSKDQLQQYFENWDFS